MLSFYIFLLAFRFIATIGLVTFSFKIARMRLTPTLTWMLITIGFTLSLIRLVETTFFVTDIAKILDGFNKVQVVADQITATVTIGLFFTGVTRIYFDLKSKFKGIIK